MNRNDREHTPKLRYQCHPKLAASYHAFDHEKYGEAVGLLEDLLQELQGKGDLLNDIGVCRFLMGDPERARAAWQKAEKFYHLVFARLLREGDRACARVVFRHFVRRYWYRPRYLRDMLSALRHST